MDRLLQDALNIQNLIPWIDDEDIIHFMRRIPLDKIHLRNPLTLQHFLKRRDETENNIEQRIEDDAREIVIVFPDFPYKELKNRLKILGNLPNRKEAVVRQLLHEKRDLDNVLTQLDNHGNRKRSTTVFESDSNGVKDTKTNIKIKIRKIEGSLEVVSCIQQDILRSSKTNDCTVVEKVNEPIEIPKDKHVESAESLKKKTAIENILNQLLQDFPSDDSIPSPSNGVTPNINPTEAASTTSTAEISRLSENNNDQPSLTPFQQETVIENNAQENASSKFDLIDYLGEVTQAPKETILSVCKKFGVSREQRPKEDILNSLLNNILGEDTIIIDAVPTPLSEYTDSDDSNSDGYVNFSAGIHPHIAVKEIKKPMDPQSKGAIPKKVTLKPAVVLGSKVVDLTASKRPIIQPARLQVNTPMDLEERAISAMPQAYLNRITMINNAEEDELSQNSRNGKRRVSDRISPRVSSRKNKGIPPRRYGENSHEIIRKESNSKYENRTSGGGSNICQKHVVPKNTTIEDWPESPDFPLALSPAPLDLSEAGPSHMNKEVPSEPCNPPKQKKRVIEERLVLRLIEMFPETSSDYIRDVCDGRKWSEFDEVVEIILSDVNHPKRPPKPPSPAKEVDPEEQFEMVKALLPDADPTYLRMQCDVYGYEPEQLNKFVNQAREKKDYPTMKEYLRKQQLSAQSKQYTTEFNIEKFVDLFPEPEKTFSDPKRSIKLDNYAQHYIRQYFENKFDRLHKKTIWHVLNTNQFKILPSDKELMNILKASQVMKSRRKRMPLTDHVHNILILQELAYVTYRKDIETFIVNKKNQEEEERKFAKENGLLNTCQCCFDDQVIPKDTFYCPNDCMFCGECVKKSCEVALGDGKTDFKCLNACTEEFTLQTLQNVLPPKMFSKLAQKKVLAEIKAAGIEELEMCPFCDFASIPHENDKVFRCFNPECMKESCRLCKEPNHVPLKCDEIEKDDDIKARVYVENKMTEALLRKCWKCGTSFFKEEGCNKMTCTCGAQMCYICKQPVTDYAHFNGIGGDKFHLCPLYSDTNEINQQDVMGAAAAAKAKIDPTNLKVDPSADVKQHYKNRKRALPHEPHLDVLVNLNRVPHPLIREQLHPPQMNHGLIDNHLQQMNALILARELEEERAREEAQRRARERRELEEGRALLERWAREEEILAREEERLARLAERRVQEEVRRAQEKGDLHKSQKKRSRTQVK